MNIQRVAYLNSYLFDSIYRLWNSAYPECLHFTNPSDFVEYLSTIQDPMHTVVVDHDGTFAGWFVDFLRDGKRWFVLIIGPKYQKKGLGSKLLDLGMKHNSELNGWVLQDGPYLMSDASVYNIPLHFYLKYGFKVEDDKLTKPQFTACHISIQNEA